MGLFRPVAQTRIHVRTISGASAALGWSGPRTVAIDRPESAGGLGIGFSGGELLFLALGACYTNDIFREAGRMKIKVNSVQVEVEGDWGGDPVRAQNVSYSVRVEAEAGEKEIAELIRHTDAVAEIHNSLRKGTQVSLGKTEAVSV